MSKPGHEVKIKEWLDSLNKKYEGTIAERPVNFSALKMRRFSSGNVKLDLALGGGWPFSRVGVIAGEYSTGKTLLTLLAAKSIERYCHNCHLFGGVLEGGIMQLQACKCGDFTPCSVLFIDLEGAFDTSWAAAHGFNDKWHVVARPETAEQSIDIVDAAIRDNLFDLIIIDSVAAMTPTKEIESSVEEWQMGLAARLINKAMRKWNASLNKMSQESKIGGPAIICLNQIRVDIKKTIGDPRSLPGGKGQEFCASIIIYTKANELTDDGEKETAWASLKGYTKKNKTYVPKVDYNFDLALKTMDEIKRGEVNNPQQLISEGKKYGIVKKVGDSISYPEGPIAVPTEKALESQLKYKPVLAQKLWRHLIKATTDQNEI